jgi:WD40 repeat protein
VDDQRCFEESPPLRVINSPDGPVTWLSWSPGGEFLAFSAEQASLAVSTLKTMNQAPLEYHQNQVGYVFFAQTYSSQPTANTEMSPRLLTVSNEDGSAVIWQIDNNTWKVRHTFKHSPTPNRRSTKINKFG